MLIKDSAYKSGYVCAGTVISRLYTLLLTSLKPSALDSFQMVRTEESSLDLAEEA